jgi:hypothetical protein
MIRIFRLFICLYIILLVISVCYHHNPEKERFNYLVDLASKDEKSTLGNNYLNSVSPTFLSAYSQGLLVCIKESGLSKVSKFDVVLVIDKDGLVIESVVYPKSTFSICICDWFSHLRLPKPPYSPIHLKFSLNEK